MYISFSGNVDDPEFMVTREDDGKIIVSAYPIGRSLYLALSREEAHRLLNKLAELLVED